MSEALPGNFLPVRGTARDRSFVRFFRLFDFKSLAIEHTRSRLALRVIEAKVR
jgi:hypothetical protein